MSDLRGMMAPRRVRFGSAGKIIGAVFAVCAATAAGVYLARIPPAAHTQSVVTSAELPATGP